MYNFLWPLPCIRYKYLPEWENAEINLALFSECIFLERVTIRFGDREGTREFRVTGLGALPPSCQRVVIRCNFGADMESGPPCVQPAIGWRVELVNIPFEESTRCDRFVECVRVPAPAAVAEAS